MAHKILATAVLGLALGVAVSGQPQPRAFFKDYARLSDGEIQKIKQGQVVTKVLGSTDKYGMLVFGAVYINAPIEKFAAYGPQGGHRERCGIDERHVEHVLQQAQRQVTGESQ